MTPRTAIRLNALGLYAISIVLLEAFFYQFARGELPCPLCLLQRVAFAALAVGPILTVRNGPYPRHYALTIIAALVGAFIAARQVFLHIEPGDAGYGSAVLGYHFYTWAFICFVIAIAACAALLMSQEQFIDRAGARRIGAFEKFAVFLVIAVTLINAGSALVECGFAFCPANPVDYELLKAPGKV
jgi:disulfide bond formation protein DsbB